MARVDRGISRWEFLAGACWLAGAACVAQSYRAAWVHYPGTGLDSLWDTDHYTASDAADRYVGASVVLIALVAAVIVVRVVVPRWSVTRYAGQVVAVGGALVAAIAAYLVASDVDVIIAEDLPLGDREVAHGPGRTYAGVGVALLVVAALATRPAKARRAWPVSRRGWWAMSAVAAGGCVVAHSYVATWSTDTLWQLYSLLGFDAPGRGTGWAVTYVVASLLLVLTAGAGVGAAFSAGAARRLRWPLIVVAGALVVLTKVSLVALGVVSPLAYYGDMFGSPGWSQGVVGVVALGAGVVLAAWPARAGQADARVAGGTPRWRTQAAAAAFGLGSVAVVAALRLGWESVAPYEAAVAAGLPLAGAAVVAGSAAGTWHPTTRHSLRLAVGVLALFWGLTLVGAVADGRPDGNGTSVAAGVVAVSLFGAGAVLAGHGRPAGAAPAPDPARPSPLQVDDGGRFL